MPTTQGRTKRQSISAIARRMAHQAQELRGALADNPNADLIAQAAACAAAILAAAPQYRAAALDWLTPQLEPWERTALDHAEVLSTQHNSTPHSTLRAPHFSSSHVYDSFLRHYSPENRKRRGVFFTPQPIADYIVVQIDRLLRDQCCFAQGLADSRVMIIDPACGTGVFLLAVIDFLRQKSGGVCLQNLLTRLVGIEILSAPALLAKLNIALILAEAGCGFEQADRIHVITGDAIAPETQLRIQNVKSRIFPVLLGNPPFSSLSTNSNDWIARLVRGDDDIRGYVRANGQHLGERKTWLHDDYVKFIRVAQWRVEEADGGLIGFVTNHGYLDNATFRLMRHELLRVFPHIEILNLHGNRRSAGVSPPRGAGVSPVMPDQSRSADTQARSASEGTGSQMTRDENVFGLDQGVAIGLFCRPTTHARIASEGETHSTVEYVDLWGSRDRKFQALAEATRVVAGNGSSSPALEARVHSPSAPDWLLIPKSDSIPCAEYASGWSLADAMPIHATAPVTARDHFVVAFTREELIARIAELRDLTIPDDEIRERYFGRTRSARYQTGDTRGWKLSTARRLIAADDRWQEQIVRCLYRPFDWRYVFWHPAMIDWPRTEVTKHLIEASVNSEIRIQNSEFEAALNRHSAFCIPNSALCLIARRQQLTAQPCTFFWISDCLALDGVIRSDNRGSESLFPLYIDRQSNFAPAFIDEFASVTRLHWQPDGRGDLTLAFGPDDLLAYIYALFHSPSYRDKHATELRRDFPRILLPTATIQFVQMARLGRELFDLHRLVVPESVLSTRYLVPGATEVPATTFNHTADISHSALRTLHSRSPSPPRLVSPSVSSFRAGGYIALKKWLQPKHRSTQDPDYGRIVAAIARTIEIMDEIDAVVP